MYLLKCPKCGNSMKYQPTGHQQLVAGKKKQCVYCGRSFEVSKHILKQME